MTFDEEYMHGYTRHEKHFNKMAETAGSVMGNITQCGIFERDGTGHALLAINRPDFGEKFIDKKVYAFHDNITYGKATDKTFVPHFSSASEELILDKEILFFSESFDIEHGFHYTEKLGNMDVYRSYMFASDNYKIYDALINDLSLVKRFIKYFAESSKDVIDYYRSRKFNLSAQRNDYFDKGKVLRKSRKEKLIDLLHVTGLLDEDVKISNREWQCLQLYCQGQSARKTGEILGISGRTVEGFFDSLKSKLKVNSKAELMETSELASD